MNETVWDAKESMRDLGKLLQKRKRSVAPAGSDYRRACIVIVMRVEERPLRRTRRLPEWEMEMEFLRERSHLPRWSAQPWLLTIRLSSVATTAWLVEVWEADRF